MWIGKRFGEECQRILDDNMRDLDCRNLEIDEIWSFVKKKQHNLKSRDSNPDGGYVDLRSLGRGYALGALSPSG